MKKNTMEQEKAPLKITLAETPFLTTNTDVSVSTGGVASLSTVPDWFYTNRPCGMPTAFVLWISNLFCLFFHVGLAAFTVVRSTTNGKSFNTPILSVYVTNLTWRADTADALVPTFQKASQGLHLTAMTMSFFLLSALFHGIVVLFNFRGGCAGSSASSQNKRIGWQNWYFGWIHQCRNPFRWIEYSFSASLMIITISVASGVSHTYMIASNFALMFCVMCFGYYSEVTCPPEPNGVSRPQRWAVRNSRPDLLVFPVFPAAFQRLAPHVLGYVPYAVVWAQLFHSFLSNTSDDGPGPPTFVYIIVAGQFVAFTIFGLTQFLLLLFEGGAHYYWVGEFSYQVLSVVSKGLLGFTLIESVFAYDNFSDAVRAAQAS